MLNTAFCVISGNLYMPVYCTRFWHQLQVMACCREIENQLQHKKATVNKQRGINSALQHQLRAQHHLLNTTKRAQNDNAMHKINHNETWTHQKLKKNSEHAKLWRLRGHTATLEVLSCQHVSAKL